MIYHLLHWQKALLDKIGFYAYEDLTFRCVMAGITSLVISFVFGPYVIRWLMKKKIGDRPEFNHADLNQLMRERANTPTMGGIFILTAIIISTLLWAKLSNPFIQKGLFILIWFGAIGAADDWLKLTGAIKQRSRDGLYPREKLMFQFGGAVLIAIFLYSDFENIRDGKMFWMPFYKNGIFMPAWMFYILTIIYISATSNAVNLTDGMDGLASGCIAIVAAILAFLCFVSSETLARTMSVTWASYLLLPHIPQAGELSIFFCSILGAILGFLWYNCHPAQVFMGDTGSLPLGAAMGYGAVVTRNEILLLLIGGVFMLELGSVVMQVGYFKYSHGKRIFRCAPIHHHFHLSGWSEPQVVVRFWLMSIFFAALALATLKIR